MRRLTDPARLTRLRRRALLVATNSANSLVPPLLGVVVPYLVLRAAPIALWGEFVRVLILVQLAAHILTWGNKEYLLRAFSREPSRIPTAWQRSLLTRLILLAATLLGVALLGLPLGRSAFIMGWLCALFILQSVDVLVLYRKDFAASLAVELAALAALIIGILLRRDRLDLDTLIALFATVHLAKALALLLRHRRVTLARPAAFDAPRINPGYFAAALPFFLLSFSGMLQSRVDLYVVTASLPQTQIGQYQVFTNLVTYLQALSAFILLPFVKSVYRLGHATTVRLSIRLAAFGALALIPLLTLVHLALLYIYRLTLPPVFLLAGGLFALPAYAYLPTIYALYRADRQTVVLWINLIGILVSLALSLLLLPHLGMLGAVVASAAAQWTMLLAYIFESRTLREEALALP